MKFLERLFATRLRVIAVASALLIVGISLDFIVNRDLGQAGLNLLVAGTVGAIGGWFGWGRVRR
jgi:hypothetical protein